MHVWSNPCFTENKQQKNCLSMYDKWHVSSSLLRITLITHTVGFTKNTSCNQTQYLWEDLSSQLINHVNNWDYSTAAKTRQLTVTTNHVFNSATASEFQWNLSTVLSSSSCDHCFFVHLPCLLWRHNDMTKLTDPSVFDQKPQTHKWLPGKSIKKIHEVASDRSLNLSIFK